MFKESTQTDFGFSFETCHGLGASCNFHCHATTLKVIACIDFFLLRRVGDRCRVCLETIKKTIIRTCVEFKFETALAFAVWVRLVSLLIQQSSFRYRRNAEIAEQVAVAIRNKKKTYTSGKLGRPRSVRVLCVFESY
jgi:Fe-S-cluster-containing dehydrogenase component